MKRFVLERTDAQISNAWTECVFCGAEILEFRDKLSAKEYTISGLCQKCQDDTFGEEEGE